MEIRVFRAKARRRVPLKPQLENFGPERTRVTGSGQGIEWVKHRIGRKSTDKP